MIRRSCDFMSNSPFGVHKQSGRRDIMIFVCDVTLQDHVIKGSCDFIDGSTFWQVATLPSLVATGIVVMEIYCF